MFGRDDSPVSLASREPAAFPEVSPEGPAEASLFTDEQHVDADIRRYARAARGRMDDLPEEALSATALDPLAVQVLTLLHQLERATITRMRRMLVTPVHKDARTTAFLSTWAFERHWIADALARVLEGQGLDPRPPAADAEPRPPRGERRFQLRLLWQALSTNLVGAASGPASMAETLVDEHLTRALYGAAQHVAPPALRDVLDRVLAIKQVHLRFIETRVRSGLARSRRARRLFRRKLAHMSWPALPDVSGDVAGLLAAIEERVPGTLARAQHGLADLPGCTGLRLHIESHPNETAAPRALRLAPGKG